MSTIDETTETLTQHLSIRERIKRTATEVRDTSAEEFRLTPLAQRGDVILVCKAVRFGKTKRALKTIEKTIKGKEREDEKDITICGNTIAMAVVDIRVPLETDESTWTEEQRKDPTEPLDPTGAATAITDLPKIAEFFGFENLVSPTDAVLRLYQVSQFPRGEWNLIRQSNDLASWTQGEDEQNDETAGN